MATPDVEVPAAEATPDTVATPDADAEVTPAAEVIPGAEVIPAADATADAAGGEACHGDSAAEGHGHGYTANRDAHLARLKRVEGQVRGIARMVEDDRYCIDILTQVSAATSALESVALALLDADAEVAPAAEVIPAADATADAAGGEACHGESAAEGHGHGYTANRDAHLARLKRVEGQVRGIARMVEDDRYCIDILTQVSAATSALESVALALLDDHLAHCVVAAAREGGDEQATKLAEVSAALRRLVKS